MNGHIRRDMVQSILIETLFFVFLLPILFRTLRGMVLPLFVVGSAVVLNFGFMAISGRAITSLGIAIPGLIVIIALCDAIHMMHRFEEAFSRTGDKFGSIVEMMKNVGQACVYTSLTTALGFFSLVVARHAAVRDFAVSITIGVGFAFITVIAVLPLALSFWPIRRPKPEGLAMLDRLSYGKLRLTLGVFALVLAFSAVGISRVVVDSSWLGELPANEPVVQDLVWYESNFQGLLTLEAEVEGALDTYEAFQAVERLRARMLREEGVTGAETYADWIHEMAGPPVDGNEIDQAAWKRAVAVLRLTGDAFPRHIVTPDFTHARLVLRTRDLGTKRYLELQAILAREAAGLAGGLQARPAGYSQMAHESNQLVVTTMAQSLTVSLAAITLFIALGVPVGPSGDHLDRAEPLADRGRAGRLRMVRYRYAHRRAHGLLRRDRTGCRRFDSPGHAIPSGTPCRAGPVYRRAPASQLAQHGQSARHHDGRARRRRAELLAFKLSIDERCRHLADDDCRLGAHCRPVLVPAYARAILSADGRRDRRRWPRGSAPIFLIHWTVRRLIDWYARVQCRAG